MTDEEIDKACENVITYAKTLGLHGVLLLSPACPDCGQCHDWHLFSDLGPDEMPDMLDHWRELVDADDPDYREPGIGAFIQ
jgi:hypothetical protein